MSKLTVCSITSIRFDTRLALVGYIKLFIICTVFFIILGISLFNSQYLASLEMFFSLVGLSEIYQKS